MTLISTKERAGEYDAIATAKPDEPLFPLQGGDRFAPKCVLLWAQQAREHAVTLPEGDARERLLAKATSAEEVAWAMQDYRLGQVDAALAQPKPAPASYNGVAHDGERDAIALRSATADRIYNAIAELSDAGDALAAMGGFAASEMKLRDAVIGAGTAVKLVEPRRHLQRGDA